VESFRPGGSRVGSGRERLLLAQSAKGSRIGTLKVLTLAGAALSRSVKPGDLTPFLVSEIE
jgi:hypothetical protein